MYPILETAEVFPGIRAPLLGIIALGAFFGFCMHIHKHLYTLTQLFLGQKHTENCRLYTKMHVVFCSVLLSFFTVLGFYNWHDMMRVQKNLEVIAQSDNRGLAEWGESQGQG